MYKAKGGNIMNFFDEYEKIFKNEIDDVNIQSQEQKNKKSDNAELLDKIAELEKKFEKKEEVEKNECDTDL